MFYIDFTSPEGNTYRIDVSRNPVIYNLPVLSVPTLRRFVVTSILFILCVPFLLVLLTVPAFCQPRAPRIRTGFLWFAWHGCLL